MSKTTPHVTPPAPVKDETPVVEHAPIDRLSVACALPEHFGKPGRVVKEGIQAFKDYDYRTMHVAVVDGALVKQEVSR